MQITKTNKRQLSADVDIDGDAIIVKEREVYDTSRHRQKWDYDGVAMSSAEFTKVVKTSIRALTYRQMSEIVKAIFEEIKRRNPLGVNLYTHGLAQAYVDLAEISAGEVGNFTSECGPKEI